MFNSEASYERLLSGFWDKNACEFPECEFQASCGVFCSEHALEHEENVN